MTHKIGIIHVATKFRSLKIPCHIANSIWRGLSFGQNTVDRRPNPLRFTRMRTTQVCNKISSSLDCPVMRRTHAQTKAGTYLSQKQKKKKKAHTDITKILLTWPQICYNGVSFITNPRYNEHIFTVLWHYVTWGFHCTFPLFK